MNDEITHKEIADAAYKYLKGGGDYHPLTIPGEMLAEACEIGCTAIWQTTDGEWAAWISGSAGSAGYFKGPTEALQAAIAKAREAKP